MKISDDIDWEIASSLPVTTITPFHALKEASLQFNEYLFLFGASGITRIMAIQFANPNGTNVITASRVDWVEDLSAHYVIKESDKVVETVKEITNREMADVDLVFFAISLLGGMEKWKKLAQTSADSCKLISLSLLSFLSGSTNQE